MVLAQAQCDPESRSPTVFLLTKGRPEAGLRFELPLVIGLARWSSGKISALHIKGCGFESHMSVLPVDVFLFTELRKVLSIQCLVHIGVRVETNSNLLPSYHA